MRLAPPSLKQGVVRIGKKEIDFSKKVRTDAVVSKWVNVIYFVFSGFFFLLDTT